MVTDAEASKLAHAPRAIRDIAARVPSYAFRTILDVGAHHGRSSLALAEALPEARIYAFEPATRSFPTLLANVAKHPNVEAVNLALGAVTEPGTMTIAGAAVVDRPPLPAGRPSLAQALGRAPGGPPLAVAEPPPRKARRQEVEIVSGAEFCRGRGIDHISLLQVATEGHDLEVVRGFGPLLENVDFVQVEAGTNDHNQVQAPLRDFLTVMGRAGFYLFHIYGEVFEAQAGGRPVSRRCNPVFVHSRIVGDMEGIS